jgi:hypothetical protein
MINYMISPIEGSKKIFIELFKVFNVNLYLYIFNY